jgi:hypothetical protein
VFKKYTTEEQNYVVFFEGEGAEKLCAKNIHTEMFPVCVEKCLSRKAVNNWVTNVSLMTKRLKRRCGIG